VPFPVLVRSCVGCSFVDGALVNLGGSARLSGIRRIRRRWSAAQAGPMGGRWRQGAATRWRHGATVLLWAARAFSGCCRPQLSCSMRSSQRQMPSVVRRAVVLQAVLVVVGRRLQQLWCCSAACGALRSRSGPSQSWCDLAAVAVWQSSSPLEGGLF
jgi:hypothetical protein